MEIQLGKQTIQLLSEKALYHAIDETLIIADLHLGKAMHFRKNGISIPHKSAEKDYERLTELLHRIKPKRVILLGDLFHSTHNYEWNLFCDFVDAFKQVEFILVLGNHDILDRSHYKNSCLTIIEEVLEEENLIYSHHPLKKVPSGKWNIAGHIHPGVVLNGKGKQHLKLPCFYWHVNQLIVPAFGSLTGLQLIDIEKEAKVFVIGKGKVIEV